MHIGQKKQLILLCVLSVSMGAGCMVETFKALDRNVILQTIRKDHSWPHEKKLLPKNIFC